MKLEPYPEYKDSGVEWIGDIPHNWESSRIKFVSERISTGKTPPSDSPKYYDYGELDWFTPGDLGDNLELKNATKKINKLALFDNKAIKYKPFSVLMVGIGATLGKIGITTGESSSNQQINAIEFDNDKLLPKYGLYFLFGVKDHIISLSNASTIGIFNQTQTENFQILKPSLKEQLSIYSFLDKKTSEINLTIEKDTRLIELLKEKRTALINHVVTKGLDPTVKMKDSGVEWISEIPEDWKIKKLKYVSIISTDKLNKKPKNSPYIGLEHIQSWNGVLLESNVDEVDSSVSRFKKGDILFGKLRPYLAKVIEAPYDGVCTTELVVIRTDKEIYPHFAFYQLLSHRLINLVNSLTYGVKMPRANPDQIMNMEICIPPIDKQKEISFYLDEETSKIDNTILKIQEKIYLLDEYKKSLIHHVVTGKVDVREVVV